VPELYAQLIAHEQRKELSNGGGAQLSANAATKGNRNGGGSSNTSRGRGGGGRGGFGRGGGGRGRGGNSGGGNGHGRNFQPGVFCQICTKEGHPTHRCYKRYDSNYNPPQQKSASSATSSSYGVDTNWYMDSGATDHITGELERLTTRNKYHGGDNVHAADGAGMEIAHIGHSTVLSPSRVFHLNNVLHVPQAHKSLCSVNQLAKDNHVYLEFHPDHFLIKEQGTRRTLHKGRCRGGLYPLHASPSSPNLPSVSSSNKQVFSSVKPSTSLWHHRLGHPSSRVVQQVLDRHKLPFIHDSNKDHVCDACQQGKSHQLPYPKSVSVSKGPLDLIFSDVWGRAPTSVG
jgi:histone deacetylase 1/2